jgi:class 3 adenylate cyclase
MTQYFQKYQAISYYLMTIMVIGVVAAQTNNFYNDSAIFTTVLSLFALFFIIALVRTQTELHFVEQQPLTKQPKRQFSHELIIYVLAGTALFFIETLVNEHSYIVASKLFSGVLIIGYFASMDSALKREHECFLKLGKNHVATENTSPVSRRFSIFLTITLLVVILANSLSAYSYLSLSLNEQSWTIEELKNAYLMETLFTLAIIITLTMRLIHSYSLNLQHLFDIQVNALQNIQDGKLDDYVPVLSADEFGLIAQKTNNVIDELREKEKIRQILESIVSPDVMTKLLHADSSLLQQGEQKHVAVFFCDLRKFTSYAEKNTPEDVIFFLNSYFAKIVDIVTEHHGVVNKFMGDAILAIFPLDNETATINDAIDTAWDIIMHSQAIRLPDGDRFNVGIGIHMGYATAGTIGSHNRFEYTFIGDTVNTASRLDGLSKRLGYSIIISDDTYKHLNQKTKERFVDLGEQKIRGKSSALHVYGASTIQYVR